MSASSRIASIGARSYAPRSGCRRTRVRSVALIQTSMAAPRVLPSKSGVRPREDRMTLGLRVALAFAFFGATLVAGGATAATKGNWFNVYPLVSDTAGG